MSGSVRIGIAVLIGGGIILSALLVRSESLAREAALQGLVVSVAPEREYIPPKDNDGDGVEDWKEPFTVPGFEPIETTGTSTDTEALGPTYTPPTTFTGRFSEALFQDYLNQKISTGGELEDTESLISNAVTAIENNVVSDTYLLADLTIVPDTYTSLSAYGNTLGEILTRVTQKYPQPEDDEMTILYSALKENEPSQLSQIDPIIGSYRDSNSEFVGMMVPRSLATEHLALINVRAGLIADLENIQKIFDDPLLGYMHLNTYRKNSLALVEAYQNILSSLEKQEIVYEEDDAGSFLYLFRK